MEIKKIKIGAMQELARREFFFYCQIMANDFYKKERAFLVEMCDTLQNFMSDDEHEVLIINLPPRHGKSRSVSLFASWLLGSDTTRKIMIGSYNEMLSTQFSKNVRDTIGEMKADEDIIVFSDIFPDVEIKKGDGAMNLWSLKGGYNNYLATSPKGTATGFGANILIVDDLIKSAEEANNAQVLENHWQWFTDTMLSRVESGGKIIIVMTRWHSQDLAGRALEQLPDVGYRIKHISMKAYDKHTNSMLCDEVLSKSDYDRKIKTMGEDIASANYQQEPIDIKGKLYKNFLTYETTPEFIKIWNVCDTADKGSDYHCSIVFGETKEHQAYVLDVIYTQEAMETTEKSQAMQIATHRVNHSRIESNNGGRGFKRNVERITKENGYHGCYFEDFPQTGNKESRILSASAWVENNVYFPIDWRLRYSDYYQAMNEFQRQGKNKHDDAPDATTLIYETIAEDVSKQASVRVIPKKLLRRR